MSSEGREIVDWYFYLHLYLKNDYVWIMMFDYVYLGCGFRNLLIRLDMTLPEVWACRNTPMILPILIAPSSPVKRLIVITLMTMSLQQLEWGWAMTRDLWLGRRKVAQWMTKPRPGGNNIFIIRMSTDHIGLWTRSPRWKTCITHTCMLYTMPCVCLCNDDNLCIWTYIELGCGSSYLSCDLVWTWWK